MAPQPLRLTLLLVSLSACSPAVSAESLEAPAEERIEPTPASPAVASEAMLKRHQQAVAEARSAHEGPPVEGKLAASHIETGVAALRYPIHLCAQRAEMSSGEAVSVTFEVDGESGMVKDVNVEQELAQSEFGECVLAACRAATFARFSDTAQRFEWKLPLRTG